ncbi:MAG: hypothetical protein KAU90_05520, partial [Sulfurovaceae bacterium]|nr:hypothetical protein [Sulfurovaceae bacterium]
YPKHHIGKYSVWEAYIIKQNKIKTKSKNSLDNRSFFIPNLQTDKEGNIIIDLKNNHQIGHQKFLGFIHTKDLKTAITQKELIVNNNRPKVIKKPKPISHQKVITKNKILYIEPKEKKTFIFKELKNSNQTQKNYKLNIEFTSNPSWYALQAMPYILYYPNKSSQDIFHKYFITQIAYKLIKISPELDEIFKNWKSPQDKEVVEIFNIKKLIENKKIYYNRLENLQNSDGGWNFHEDNKSDWNTTQYIAKGFVKLKEIGIDKTNTKMMSKAIKYIDNQILKEYQKVKNSNRLDKDNLNHLIIDYLYIRTFYNSHIISKKMYKYYLNQIKKYWRNKTLSEQAIIALILNKKLAKKEAIKIVKSIKAKPITYNQPNIETHTKIMKLFDTIDRDKKLVEFMKIWLLKNRQNKHWNTTKATSCAIYTLLWNNAWVVNRSKLVNIKFPRSQINYKPIIEEAKKHIQKGIGYLKVSFDKFDKNMATIEINNPNNNSEWGILSWQYIKKDKNKTITPKH